MGRDCKREKRGKKLSRDKYYARRMGQDCKREKKRKHWDEINIKPNEWSETVRDRGKEKTGMR